MRNSQVQRGLVFIDVECFFDALSLDLELEEPKLSAFSLRYGLESVGEMARRFTWKFDVVLVCERPGPTLRGTRMRFPGPMQDLVVDATWESAVRTLPAPRHVQILDYIRRLGASGPGRRWVALDSDASQWPRPLRRHVIDCAGTGFGLRARSRLALRLDRWPAVPRIHLDEDFGTGEVIAGNVDVGHVSGHGDEADHAPSPGLVRLFPRAAIEKVCELPMKYGGDRRKGYQRIAESLSVAPMGYRGVRRLPGDMDRRLDLLVGEMPNFHRAIETLRLAFRLQNAGDGQFKFAPLLLAGPPGVGKSYFARRLAETFRSAYRPVNMETTTAGFVLSGTSSQWGESAPGLVFNTLVHGRQANPVILLDEVDKASTDARHSPLGPLYSLLEPMSAKAFIDEYCPELPMDTSHINWIIAANEVEKIPEPLRNRMVRVDIPAPNRSERMGILRCLYRDMREQEAWGKHFGDELSDAVAERLCVRQGSVRDLRHLLLMAFAHAIARGSPRLELRDLAPAGGCGRRVDLRNPDALHEMEVQGHA
ncbi:MAG: AAA family ATPase [Pseudoxanthomonas suwonensis]|nr:AAA family ATPase [Pseudoxanthomonas suwonensis]